MQTDANKRAKKKYDEKTAVYFGLKLNKNTDADIIAHLKEQGQFQPYIKALIRSDMK